MGTDDPGRRVVLILGLLFSITCIGCTTSPENGRIAFLASTNGSNWTLHVVDAEGSNQRKLAEIGFPAERPAWSPDGKKILFTGNRNLRTNVYIINADGSNEQRLTDHSYAHSPERSPDGSRIVFVSSSALYIRNFDGTNEKKLNDNRTTDSSESFPAWSPDGKWIAFLSINADDLFQGRELKPGYQFRYQLYVVHPDGSGLKKLAADVTQDPPSWSPDAQRIAFLKARVEGERKLLAGSGISIVDITNFSIERLAEDVRLQFSTFPIVWSPDGKKLAFVASGTWGVDEIYSVDADGSNLQGLSRTQRTNAWLPRRWFPRRTNHWFPSWSPDGKWIAFTSGGTNDDIYIMGADGLNMKRLTNDKGYKKYPVWAPRR